MGKTWLVQIALFSFWTFGAINARAQHYAANVKHYGTDVGLSHHDVRDVAIDQRGLIWCATRNGLNRFDGHSFKSYGLDDGLNSADIDLLYADGDVLWCCHYGETSAKYEDLTLFHTIQEKTIPLVEWTKPFNIAAHNIIDVFKNEFGMAIQVREKNNLQWYLHTKESGLTKLNIADSIQHVIGISRSGNVWFMDRDANYALKKMSSSGQILYDIPIPNKKLFEIRFLCNSDQDLGTARFFGIDSVYEVRNGKLLKLDKVASIQPELKDPIYWVSDYYSYHPKSGHFWYSYQNVCALVDTDGNVLYNAGNAIKDANQKDLIVGNTILQCTNTGLYIIELKSSNFKSILNVNPLAGFRGISKFGGVHLFNSYSGTYSWPNQTTNPIPSLSNKALALQYDQNQLYVSDFHKIHAYDASYKLQRTYAIENTQEIWCIYPKGNKLLYGGQGLHLLDLVSGEVSAVQHQNLPSIEKATLYAVVPQKMDKDYWLCTTQGLFQFDFQNGVSKRFYPTKSTSNEKYTDIRHLYEDSLSGDFWMAVYNHGLLRYNPESGRQKLYTFNESANFVHSVYPDKHGNLWLSGEGGIIQFNKTSETFKAFLENDGLSNNEFNRISHFQDKDGTIFFGGVMGVTYFHPDNFTDTREIEEHFEVLATDVWQYKHKKRKNEIVSQEFILSNNITLHPNDRLQYIKLATNNIEFGGQAVYRYRIKSNAADDWKAIPSNQLQIGGLPFGTHRIEVGAVLPTGRISNKNLIFSLEVLVPIYLRWWFIALIAVAIIASFISVLTLRTRRLKAQKLSLEKEVENRTLEITKDKAVIEKQADELKSLDKFKSQFFTNVSHELRTPLTLVLGPLENLIHQDEVTLPTMAKSRLKHTLANAKKLQGMVNEILDLAKLEAGKLELEFSAIKMNEYLNRVIFAFESAAAVRRIHIRFQTEFDKKLSLAIDHAKFEKVLNNLMSNAIKFSDDGAAIDIEFKSHDQAYQIEVKDQGVGIPSEDLEHIFNRYAQSKKGKPPVVLALGSP